MVARLNYTGESRCGFAVGQGRRKRRTRAGITGALRDHDAKQFSCLCGELIVRRLAQMGEVRLGRIQAGPNFRVYAFDKIYYQKH